jgi:hypothetical protein
VLRHIPPINPAPFVLLALAVGYGIGRYFHRREQFDLHNPGEALVSSRLRAAFRTPDYCLLNNVTLELEDGTTRIDHILVSRFGVFVIETKHYKGWIFGNPDDANWTQVLFNGKYKFQNPILQNKRHVRAVERVLHFLPPEVIHPVVVFSGDSRFKTDVPDGVVNLSELVNHVRRYTDDVIAEHDAQFAIGRLEALRLPAGVETDLFHLGSLARRRSRTQ